MGLSSALLLKLALAACMLAMAVHGGGHGTIGSGCYIDSECGDVNISYPFSTNKGCVTDPSFLITCGKNDTGYPVPYLATNSSIQVLDIYVETGEMLVSTPVLHFCPNGTDGNATYDWNRTYSSMPQKFAISNTKNNFTVVGCDIGGFFHDLTESTYGRCEPKCNNWTSKKKKSCSSVHCYSCQITFDKAITNYSITIMSMMMMYDNLNISGLRDDPCSYAFFAETGFFKSSSQELSNLRRSTVFLNWAVGNRTCDEVKNTSSYACKGDSVCQDYGESGIGYFCECKPGFTGNPYLSLHDGGCEDVDECRTSNPCMDRKLCRNWAGGYTCSCPRGKKGKGFNNGTASDNWGCTDQEPLLPILLGITVAILVVFTLVSALCWAQKQRTLKKLRQRNFEQNGGNLLPQQFSQRQGYTDNRMKIFTEDELKNATNNFDESKILGRGGQGIVYKGILSDNTPVAIKKSRVGGDIQNIKSFINEVFVLSQINHRNVVKLLGCCFETEVPLLVYEFVDNGTLLDHIDPLKNDCSITWETRLRIAAEMVEAISYLHSAASIPIIHRDIKSTNILLDHNGRAKVSDFGASRLVHIDETQVATVIQGTIGYLDPEYLQTGQLNEKSDVYSFGIVLVELLTGKKVVEFNKLAMYFVSSMREDRLWEILDKRVLDHKKNAKQLKEVALLARKCIRVNGEERPTMKEVAMELEGLIAMEKHPGGMDEDMMVEESEYLPGHILDDGYEGAGASTSTSIVDHDSIQKQAAFEIANGR